MVDIWRGFLFLWVLGMGYVIFLWHSLSLPYNYLSFSLFVCLPGLSNLRFCIDFGRNDPGPKRPTYLGRNDPPKIGPKRPRPKRLRAETTRILLLWHSLSLPYNYFGSNFCTASLFSFCMNFISLENVSSNFRGYPWDRGNRAADF